MQKVRDILVFLAGHCEPAFCTTPAQNVGLSKHLNVEPFLSDPFHSLIYFAKEKQRSCPAVPLDEGSILSLLCW